MNRLGENSPAGCSCPWILSTGAIMMAVIFQRWDCWVVWVWVWICTDLCVHSVGAPGRRRRSPGRRTLIEPSPFLGTEPQPGSHSHGFPESDLCWPLQRSWRRWLDSGSLQFWVPQRPWSLWQWVLSREQLLSTGVWGIPETSSWRKPSFCTVIPLPSCSRKYHSGQTDLCLLLVPSLLHLVPKPA